LFSDIAIFATEYSVSHNSAAQRNRKDIKGNGKSRKRGAPDSTVRATLFLRRGVGTSGSHSNGSRYFGTPGAHCSRLTPFVLSLHLFQPALGKNVSPGIDLIRRSKDAAQVTFLILFDKFSFSSALGMFSLCPLRERNMPSLAICRVAFSTQSPKPLLSHLKHK
jgi:hypothetical protein